MKVKVLREDADSVSFVIEGISVRVANILRKAAANEVPTLAIEDVSIYENSSVFFDEYLAHRLGLVPLVTDLKGAKVGEKIKFTLDKQGPCTVYSGDLKFKDSKTKPLFDNMPVIKLGEKQRLRLEGNAEINLGREHVKWQPAAVSYQAYPSLEVDKKKASNDVLKKIAEACPGVYEFDGKELKLVDPTNWDVANYGAELSKGGVRITAEPEKVIFYVESFGQMPSREVLDRALDALDEKVDEFAKKVKK